MPRPKRKVTDFTNENLLSTSMIKGVMCASAMKAGPASAASIDNELARDYLEEFDAEVEVKCRRIEQSAEDEIQELKSAFALQLCKLPPRIRNMPLKEFCALNGIPASSTSSSSSVLTDFASSQATASSSTSTSSTSTSISATSYSSPVAERPKKQTAEAGTQTPRQQMRRVTRAQAKANATKAVEKENVVAAANKAETRGRKKGVSTKAAATASAPAEGHSVSCGTSP